MEDSFYGSETIMGVPTLAEGEDLDSIGVDADEPDDSPQPTVDRYGFSGGHQYTDPNKEFLPPIDVLRSREMKWLNMCSSWDYWASVGRKKLRDRCRKGIPDSVRGKAWQRLVGSRTANVNQITVIVEEAATETPNKPSNSLSFLRGDSRLSGSRSLPTVVTNSPSTSRIHLNDSSNRKPGASIPPPAVSMVSSRAMVSAPSPAMYRSLATASRKSAQHFQSFRKFGSLFRLNNSATNTKVVPPQTPKPANQTSGQEEDDVDAMANFYQHGEQGGSGGETAAVGVVGERQRTYSAALPSAAYLGISIDGNTGGAGAQGTLTTNGNAVVQPSESITTTTSTGVSTDAYSLTTSSNFFSTAESSVESLGVAGETKDAFYSPDLPPRNSSHRNRLFTSEGSGAGDLSPAPSSQFSTLSSRCSSSVPGDDDGGEGDSSPALSLLGSSTNQQRENHNRSGVSDRDRTLVAPANSSATSDSPDPYILFAAYADQEGDEASCDQIRKDIHRQFPFHELFCSKNSHGRESLFKILNAYTVLHPSKGYCQGQAPLAAVLLMFMPEAEAFWTFNEVCERYLVSYFDDGLELIQIDGQVLYGLLKRLSPQIYKFLMKHGADPVMLVVEWFMCVYTRTLPWSSALRVLDMFFCEGKIIIFKVGLLLLHRCFESPAFRKSCGGVDEIIMQAQSIPASLDNPEDLVRDILRINIGKRQIAREVVKQSQRWRSRMSALLERTNEK